MARALVGRIIVNENCDFEFVPTAAGSRPYPLEVVGCNGLLPTIVKDNRPVIVSSWSSTGDGVLLVNMDGVSELGDETTDTCRDTIDVETGGAAQVQGTVVHVTAFLRIKNPSDPFNNCYCIHLRQDKCLIMRGPEYVPMRLAVRLGDHISASGFKRIRIPNFEHKKLYISQPASVISACVNPLTREEIPSNQLAEFQYAYSDISGSVLQIDAQMGDMWVSTPDRPVRVLLGKWGLCERRRLSVGSRVKILNCHCTDGVYLMCPSMTCMQVQEIPPISAGVVRIYSVTEKAVTAGCLKCKAGGNLQLCKATTPASKFNVTSLLKCDCYIDCELVEAPEASAEVECAKTQFNFGQCLKHSERCLSLMCISDLFSLSSPPVFKVSFFPACSMSPTGAAASDFAKAFSGLPKNVLSLIFTPQKPLNAHAVVRVSCPNGRPESEQFYALVPRDTKITPDMSYHIREMIVLDASATAPLHGLVVDMDMTNPSVAECSGIKSAIDTKSRTKLYRRRFLQERIDRWAI